MAYELILELTVDRMRRVSLRDQILQQIKAAISDGTLAPDDPLPSTRAVADSLGVSRTTVLGCYLELEGDGWVYGVQGAGTFVARTGTATAPVAVPAWSDEVGAGGGPVFDFRPGVVDPTILTGEVWRSLWQGASASAFAPDPCGLAQLRTSVANHLSSARGLHCTPEQIVVCAGTAEAIAVLSVALQWAGKRVAVEDPGYPAIRDVLRRMSVDVTSIDVTDPSRVPANLEKSEPLAAVYLTPTHQYPLGHRMELDERRRLLNWADRTGTVLVEDDYDSEFHYGASPTTSMAGLSPNSNIVYIGTVSKVLDPGLRMAYLRMPPHLATEVCDARNDLGSTVAGPVQLGIATVMQTGQLSRHIARARRTFADRRRALLQSLNGIGAVHELRGIAAGLHVVADLDHRIDAARVVTEAAERGIAVQSLDDFRTCHNREEPALVFGYSRHPPSMIRRGIDQLAACPELTVHSM